MLRRPLYLALTLLLITACSDDTTPGTDAGVDAANPDMTCKNPDAAIPGSCATNKTEVFKGKYQVVINKLQMGSLKDGFDLNNEDCDNDMTTGVDNVLWVIGTIANTALDESMAKGEIAIPFEFYDVDSATTDDCFNYALYVGRFPNDYDGDSEKAGGPTSKPGKDCNDNDKTISPKATEVAGNGVDDNCNGKVDEDASGNPSQDTSDADGDKQTIKDGDCDDRKDDSTKGIMGSAIKKGGTEVCGDGLDNDCNGTADEGCLPWTKGTKFPVEEMGLTTAKDQSLVVVKGATIKGGKLNAGPSMFGVNVEVDTNMYIELNLTHVFVQADVTIDTAGMHLKNALLSGVLSANAMGQSPNLLSDFYGEEDDTLLDVLAGPIGSTLGLPEDKDGNRVPDVDVDKDGIETFLDKDLDGDKTNFRIDTCVDGDGTTIQSTYDPKTKKIATRCTDAKDSKGDKRFVDGWSISLKFDAEPTILKGTVATATTK